MRAKNLLHGVIRGGWMAWALAGCGQTGARETPPPEPHPQRAPLTARCEARPPGASQFEPELEWAWTGSAQLPHHVNVRMTPVVLDVSGDGVPDVLFNTYRDTTSSSDGVLRAVDGATGHELWTVTDERYRVRPTSNITAGDLDGDGQVDICTAHQSSVGLVCFEHDGTFKFRTPTPGNNWGGPSMADLDGDGQVELLNGHAVFSATGALKWVGTDGPGGGISGPISFAADIDQDGQLELVNGRSIYRHDGQLKCSQRGILHGLSAVANFDGDPAGEVVVVWNGFVSLLDDDCTLLWTVGLPGGGVGGAPTVADLDGDGLPEVGVSGTGRYTVLEHDGTVKWTQQTNPASTNRSSSAAFDFDGDGRAEVVYADEGWLRICDGSTGEVRLEVPHSSCTSYENPVVADVDGDGNAELLVAQNTTSPTLAACGDSASSGLRLYRERRDGWVTTRGVWNQHAYSVTHIGERGQVPRYAPAPWLHGFNAFRSNSQGTPTLAPFAAPDLQVASEVTSTCEADTFALRLRARVRNDGDAAASAGLRVAFYQGPPGAKNRLLGTSTLPARLGPGAEAEAELRLPVPPGVRAKVWVVVDDDGTGAEREHECDELNNSAAHEVSLQCAPSAAARWSRTGSMRLPRLQHTATALEDGRVLVAGGFGTSSEVYEPALGTWQAVGTTLTQHRGHSATRLADGRVLIAGGGEEPSSHVNAELYTPTTRVWRAAGALRVLRYHHTASLLTDGRVLVVGGASSEYGGEVLGSAELYDPATDTWSPTGALGAPRAHHTASRLPDGRVLVVGGLDASGSARASAELYDPATGRFTPVAGLAQGHAHHTATVLADGRVLVVGGASLVRDATALAEVFNPGTLTWSAAGSPRAPRRDHVAHLLSTGRVLVAGGYHESAGILTSAELYDPVGGTWSDTVPMAVDRYQPAAARLRDGSVLVVGGVSNTDPASAEIYTP